jgi:hypothetical protein
LPTKEDIFSDVQPGNAADYAGRIDTLKSALAAAIKRHDSGVDSFIDAKTAREMGTPGSVGIIKGFAPGRNPADRLLELAERFSTVTKGLSADEQAAITASFAELRELAGDVGKDITVTSPGNLHPYDLEEPAKVLVPRFTPLRNMMPRQRGQGTAREYRRILGYTNTGMGGVPDQTPFFNSESDANDPSFGQLALRRGQKISYAMDIHTASYMEMSLSDLVSWKSQFTNLGFADSRQLSQMALLWSHLLGEEKAILWGRGGSQTGYEGPVGQPAGSIAASGSGGTIPTATYSYKITAYSGMGETAPVSLSGTLSVTSGQNVVITLTSDSNLTTTKGTLSYKVYAQSGGSGSETLQGQFIPVTSSGTTTITLSSFVSGGAGVPSADTSSNTNAYDGFLAVLTDPAQAGYTARFNQSYQGKSVFTLGGSNNVGDEPWQDAFASLYASVFADPEEVWLAAPQRRQLTDYLRAANGTTAGYRITMDPSQANGVQVGAMVTGLVNESSPTSRVVDLRVHPYMPQGCSFIRTVNLPIPDTHIPATSSITEVQGYMSVDWPAIQFTYDASTYWYGTLIHYAPRWSGAITGLQ